MADIIESQASANRRDVLLRYKDMGDGTYAPVVATTGGSSGGGGAGSDRELVVSTYRCKTAFSGASVGDTITATQIIDVTDTPSTVSTIWRNQTTALDLGSTPSAGNLELVGSTALTDAQLRATLVPVDTLATLGAARVVAMGSGSANQALTSTCRRVSIHASVAGFFAIGVGAQTASTTTHYIGAGERLDFDVPANSQIAAIRATTDGTLYISELL